MKVFISDVYFLLLYYTVGSTVDIVSNEDNYLQGIFYQDNSMKNKFDSFPELLTN